MAKNGISNHQTGFYIFVVSAHFSPRGIMLRITGIAQEIDTNLLRHFFLKILMHSLKYKDFVRLEFLGAPRPSS